MQYLTVIFAGKLNTLNNWTQPTFKNLLLIENPNLETFSNNTFTNLTLLNLTNTGLTKLSGNDLPALTNLLAYKAKIDKFEENDLSLLQRLTISNNNIT